MLLKRLNKFFFLNISEFYQILSYPIIVNCYFALEHSSAMTEQTLQLFYIQNIKIESCTESITQCVHLWPRRGSLSKSGPFKT